MEAFFPISEISTYHSKWVIRARVTAKGSLRQFNGKSGPGQVFDVSLLDESAVEIRANFFGAACDKYYGVLEPGKVYTLTGGSVRIANRQFNRCSHRYEITFDRDTKIEQVDDCEKIKSISYDIVNLKAVMSRALPCSVDLCGVIVSFRPTVAFTSSAGRELVKRDITLADDSMTSMTVALWGERAKQEDKVFDGNPVVCLKGVTVKEFQGGRSGSLLESGVMKLSSDIPEATKLQQWWAKDGAATAGSFTSASLASEGVIDLQAVQTKPVPCVVEMCGIIVAFRDTFSFTSKEGRELTKREVTIADDTATSLTVTLWGTKATQDNSCFEGNPLVTLRGVRIGEWNGGRSGSMLEAGSVVWKPSTPEAQRIQAWWSQGGSGQTLKALSVDMSAGGGAARATAKASSMAELRELSEQVTTQGEVYTIISRLALVQMKKQGEPQPLYYLACQEQRPGSTLLCNKRVDSTGFCASCNRVVKVAPRLNLRCRLSDFSDSAWLTTFHEPAQKAIQMTAEEVQGLEEGEGGRDSLEAAVRSRYYMQPMQFSIRAKLDTYQGEVRPNITCVDARPLQRGSHAREMLKGIREMLAA